MMAGLEGHDKCIKLLIEAGASVNVKDNKGHTALTCATSRYMRYKSHEQLIEAEADASVRKHGCVEKALDLLDKKKELMDTPCKCVEILENKGADVDEEKSDGGTALMEAAVKGHDKCVEKLIDAGADVNLINYTGLTAVQCAALGGHDQCVKLLIEAGADVSLQNEEGYTALMWAAVEGNPGCVEQLIKAGADVNIRKYEHGDTAIIDATSRGNS